MKKLWQKNKEHLNPLIEAFETKGDLLMDQKLLPYDIQGSIAHAEMLNHIGILTTKEYIVLKKGLNEIKGLNQKGKFQLTFGDEDMHTKIENYLTINYGEVGKKIHTARSRNDQILTALRLYYKDSLKKIILEVEKLIKEFESFSKKYKDIPLPGYTHMQKAMPSSVSLWSESFTEAFSDNIFDLQSVYTLINQSPLGSAAGYGLPFPINREYSAKILDFSKVQNNPIYCQNSKGKFDASILSSLISIQMDINKFASDILLFTTSEFNFFEVSKSLSSGSSMMPQKKNMDVAELLRSKVHVILGHFTQVVSTSSNLISGYNRDLQDNKKALIESFEITLESIQVTRLLLNNLKPNKKILRLAMTNELYATEKALNQVLNGVPFRDAYNNVAKTIK